MILKHTIKPELVPQIVAVMRSATQSFGRLSSADNCFCAVGCIAEAYRRAHSVNHVTTLAGGDIWWTYAKYAENGPLERVLRGFAPGESAKIREAHSDLHGGLSFVAEWASSSGSFLDIDGRMIEAWNDIDRKPLSWFADVLEGKEV